MAFNNHIVDSNAVIVINSWFCVKSGIKQNYNFDNVIGIFDKRERD